jgi:hypothetical protein
MLMIVSETASCYPAAVRGPAPAGETGVHPGHPLARVLPLLRDTLVAIADEALHLLVVTDAQGRILWCEGPRDVLRRARCADLVDGPWWDGGAGRLVRTHHAWTGAACPVHDPDTGEVVGAVDVSAPSRSFHPTTLALVVAAARLAEGHLAAQLAVRDERLLARNLAHLTGLRDEPGALLTPTGRVLAAQPAGRLPARVALPRRGDRVALADGGEGVLEPLVEGWLLRLRAARSAPRPVLSLPFLGAERPQAGLDGRPVPLTLRHAELLALLALRPDGCSADELATALHGDPARADEVRGDVHRLRGVLDPGVLLTRPYRLRARIEADFVQVRADLAAGAVRAAARAHRGPLLPRSGAPAVREERELLAASLRRAVLDSRDADAMWALAGTPDGAGDVELAHRLLRALPPRDPRRPVLTARLTVPAR